MHIDFNLHHHNVCVVHYMLRYKYYSILYYGIKYHHHHQSNLNLHCILNGERNKSIVISFFTNLYQYNEVFQYFAIRHLRVTHILMFKSYTRRLLRTTYGCSSK